MDRTEDAGPRGETAQRAERAAAVLRARIAAGEVAPGAKLPEVQLCADLQVSRHTLRSALQTLAAEGLAERRPNVGVFVHAPTSEDLAEIYRVRRVVEIGAVRQAAFDAATLDELDALVAHARKRAAADDVAAVAEANQRFHRRLVAQAGSEQLSTFMERILARMRLVFHVMRGEPTFHVEFAAGNAELVRLLRADDRDGAERHMESYFDHAEQLLGARLGG
ncbi:GntR family transcriptional regulator [Nesterenkonia halobia]|uniref:GntR family transcriptional regulator n=1 Tax=Nesterenkonia halobia TaxID=37922 RepID=A0ABP6REE0_9MICC